MSVPTSINVALWIAAIGAWAVGGAVLWLARCASELTRALRSAESDRAAATARTAAYFFFTDVSYYKVQLELAQGVVDYALKKPSMSLSEVQRLLKGRMSLPSLTDNPAVIGQLPHGLTIQIAGLASEIRTGSKTFEEFEVSASLHPDESIRQSEGALSALQAMQTMLAAVLQTVRTAEQSLSKFIYPEKNP
jgi:hypothetical protein